ncbi:hypothetical protein [Luteolibacter sp. LG18]|uniref:hypothetical protein n=1 Tax=Luteolibacter sp. LG18 TaxID=2819286 RepID=UPI002B30293D|nr:hypothetical protein llg_42240 [Luteolibacter sp. LG18]
MEKPEQKHRMARRLAWLALAMMLVAQCLPWEKTRLEVRTWVGVSEANSNLLPIARSWTFNMEDDCPSWPAGNHIFVSGSDAFVQTTTICRGHLPEVLQLNLAAELWHSAEGWAAAPSALPGMEMTTFLIPATISIWLLTIALMTVAPFLPKWRSRPKVAVWMARLFVVLILTWLIRNLILGFETLPYEFRDCLGHVGAGYWLTLAALGVETVALFLISAPMKHQPPTQATT